VPDYREIVVVIWISIEELMSPAEDDAAAIHEYKDGNSECDAQRGNAGVFNHRDKPDYLITSYGIHFDPRTAVRTPSCLSSAIMMIRSGAEGLVGYRGRSTANAFEAEIDNKIATITRELFVFMVKP
jgi:hypothetical protein